MEIVLFLSFDLAQCAPVNSEKLVRLRKLVLMELGEQGAHFYFLFKMLLDSRSAVQNNL